MDMPASNVPDDPAVTMRSILKRIATGPELSKDISYEEARTGMRYVLDGSVDPVQAGIFLIALRMKRETDDENRGVLQAIRDATHTVTANVDDVLDLADPYDGFTRTLPVSPFLPAVLAACGVASVTHGVERMGPKFGVTHRQVLRAAGVAVDLTVEEAAARLADPAIGWAYVDQKVFCPKLHKLADFRTLIVKRPAITTAEVLAGPIRGRRRTHLVTGYVHKPYPRIYALLARHAGFDSALIVRGVEGGVLPSLRQSGKAFYYREGGEERALDFAPAEFGIEQSLRAAPLPPGLAGESEEGDDVAVAFDSAAIAQAAADEGRAALAAKPGPVRDSLVSAAALCLWHLKRHDSLGAAADAVRAVLDDGSARERFERGA
jgi:anthranilate phosphoribosyltransferase